MAKRRGRKPVKKAVSAHDSDAKGSREPEIEDKEAAILQQEGVIMRLLSRIPSFLSARSSVV